MISPDNAVRARARRAYERSRWLDGGRGAWPVIALVPIALALHGAQAALATTVAGALLAVALAVAGWRGGAWRRGALPGVAAGLPLFLMPSVLMAGRAACGATCPHQAMPWLTCFAGCALAALAGGLVLATLARRDRAPLVYAASAGLAAVLTASMTCTVAGAAGLLGGLVGLAAGSAPAVAGALRRA